MKETIQRTKLCEDVAERILDRIRSQHWCAGTKLPAEPELAEQFDVSRSTIRTAVRSLQLAGILRTRGGSGTYVAESAPAVLDARDLALVMADPQNLRALVQARYILEPQLAALAAKNATPEQVEQLFSILRDMEHNRDRHSLMTHGYRFHQAVAQFAHNQVLYGFFQSAAKQLRGLRVLESLTLEVYLEGIEEHRAIAKAISQADDALAKQLMRSHLKKDYAQYLERTDILE